MARGKKKSASSSAPVFSTMNFSEVGSEIDAFISKAPRLLRNNWGLVVDKMDMADKEICSFLDALSKRDLPEPWLKANLKKAMQRELEGLPENMASEKLAQKVDWFISRASHVSKAKGKTICRRADGERDFEWLTLANFTPREKKTEA